MYVNCDLSGSNISINNNLECSSEADLSGRLNRKKSLFLNFLLTVLVAVAAVQKFPPNIMTRFYRGKRQNWVTCLCCQTKIYTE